MDGQARSATNYGPAPPRNRGAAGWLVWTCSLALTGCAGAQSALAPAGQEAERIASLFWWMATGAIVVWLGVLVLAAYAVRADPNAGRDRQAKLLILSGALVPTVVLAALLIYGLSMLPPMIAPAPEGSLRITVFGEQWWWRMRYEPPGTPPFEVANEVRLPVGEPVQFVLRSNNVIHSFWIPSLGGKMDMVPGRINQLTLRPTKTGSFRGACAEFCGVGHANMAFDVLVLPRAEFDRWVEQQRKPAAAAAGSMGRRP